MQAHSGDAGIFGRVSSAVHKQVLKGIHEAEIEKKGHLWPQASFIGPFKLRQGDYCFVPSQTKDTFARNAITSCAAKESLPDCRVIDSAGFRKKKTQRYRGRGPAKGAAWAPQRGPPGPVRPVYTGPRVYI